MKSYWDEHPVKFRAAFLCLTAVFLFISLFYFFRISRTVFSGTTYLALPSSYYVTSTVPARKIDTGNRISESVENIEEGSFIIAFLGRSDTVGIRYDSLIDAMQSYQYMYVKVFNIHAFREKPESESGDYTARIDSFQVSRGDVPSGWIKYLPTGILIGKTENSGATDRAGIKPGDVMLTLDDSVLHIEKKGTQQALSTESLRFLRSHEPGKAIPYKILRGLRTITFNVELATFGISIDSLVLSMCSLIYFAAAILFAMLRPRFFAARITAAALLFVGLELATFINFYPAQMDLFSFLQPVINNLAMIFMVPLLGHSLVFYPVENTRLSSKRISITMPYIVSAVLALVFLTIYLVDINLFESPYINYPLVGVFTAEAIYVFVSRILILKRTSDEYRKLTRLTRWAYSLGFLIVTVEVVFGVLGWSKEYLKYTYTLVTVVPIILVYSAWKYRLLDINLKIRRNIQYSFLYVSLYIICGLVFCFALLGLSHLTVQFPNLRYTGTAVEILNHPLEPWLNTFYEKMFGMVIILLFSLGLLKVIRYFKGYLDKKYFRSSFDFRYIQTELIKLFDMTKELLPLAKLIVEKLSDLVHLKRTGVIFFQGEKRGVDSIIYCYDNLQKKHVDFRFDDDIEHTINSFRGAFSIEYLPLKCREFLAENRFQKVIPVRHNESLIAALFIGGKLSETALNENDIDFLTTIAKNFSSAIENAFLYEELAEQERIKQELAIARRIQLSSLPQQVPDIDGLQISAVSLPAHEVGGDFYDFLNGRMDELTIILGDVSGKGTSAALYMSKIQGIMQTLHTFCDSPGELLERANKQLYRHIESNSYITAIAARILTSEQKMSIVRAGHLPLFRYRADEGVIEKVTPKGIGLGLSGEEIFNRTLQEITISYNPKDVFLLFSDGLTEARNQQGSFFGQSEIEKCMLEFFELPASEIKDRLLNRVMAFSGSENLYDDITLIVIKAV